MNYIGLDRTQWFILNNHEDLFFFLQVDKVTKPGFFGKPVRPGDGVGRERKKNTKTKFRGEKSIRHH